MRDKLHFVFLNIGHFLDHFFMLIFATVAALALTRDWGLSYAELIPYATPGFFAFGAFAVPAGWLADRWSREGMLTVFFIGIGCASIATALAATPFQVGLGLFAIGVFASIYHPVGIALVLEGRERTGMAVAINGVWGNMGVALAALLTAVLIDNTGWRSAFVWPGFLAIAIGLFYGFAIWRTAGARAAPTASAASKAAPPAYDQSLFLRVVGVIFFTTALGGLVFQSTTFALPKVLDERAVAIAGSATMVGWFAFAAFAIGSMGQLVVGYFVDRFSPRRAFTAVAALQVIFFTAMITATGWPAVIIAVGFMFASFGQIPINDVLVGRVAKAEWRSRLLAVRYAITITVMASSIPLIAWIYANWGFSHLFGVLAVTGFLVFVATLALPRTIGAPRTRPATQPLKA